MITDDIIRRIENSELRVSYSLFAVIGNGKLITCADRRTAEKVKRVASDDGVETELVVLPVWII